MTVTTTTHSAYPTDVDELVPHARDLAADLGGLPSRNKLMKTFKVGAPKAKALLDVLTSDPAPDPPAEPGPERLNPVVWIRDEVADLLDSRAPAAVELVPVTEVPEAPPQVEPVTDPDPKIPADPDPAPAVKTRAAVTWPVLILCLPAFVAIWAGWVEMGRLTGFGKVTLLPGIADSFQLDTAITLPIGVETYAAYALWVWLSGRVTGDARRFAKWSAIASLGLGGLGQVTYHLMNAWHWTSAPWPITAVVACIPVAVLGMGAALAHLMHNQH